jgi:hypothetical protein
MNPGWFGPYLSCLVYFPIKIGWEIKRAQETSIFPTNPLIRAYHVISPIGGNIDIPVTYPRLLNPLNPNPFSIH